MKARKKISPADARRRLLSSRELFDLLRLRGSKDRAGVDAAIEAGGARELTILMADSSGFTRRTHAYGILQFLAVMTHCYDRLIPLLEKRDGICLSHNADNILAVFGRPADAVQAAVDMNRWLAKHNKGKPDAQRFNICIGVHYGRIIRLKDGVFGEPVNLAAKIGEDMADKDEILVTREVWERLAKQFSGAYARTTPVGGRMVELYRIRWS